MKERGILFTAPMVRAILGGKKTQTRRIVKPQPASCTTRIRQRGNRRTDLYGKPGEGLACLTSDPWPYPKGLRLWVRERWRESATGPEYYADCPLAAVAFRDWRSSLFMPRRAARITLEVTNARAERLHDITEEDARAEGILSFTKDGDLMKFWPCDPHDGPLKCAWADLPRTARDAYHALWESIHGPGSWDANPWVWVVEFRPLEEAPNA